MSHAETSVVEKVAIKTPNFWTVVLHNDDFTPMDFVIMVLMQIFHLNPEESEIIMLSVHNDGKAPIPRKYSKDIAVTKANQVCLLAEKFQHPLLATPEQIA